MIETYVPNVSCKIERCPVCGKKLVLIDNLNYFTMICKKCHTTVFEEFNGTVHKIKHGIMKDGYNVSLDIFIKALSADSIAAFNMNESDRENYYRERLFDGYVVGCGIYQPDIFNYFEKEMIRNKQKLKNPCIYFNGYEKYLDYMKNFEDEFNEMRNNALEAIKNR